jgi:hypothetical protein
MANRIATWGAALALVAAALPASSQSRKTDKTNEVSAKRVTLIGCVELEKEYRAELGARAGGPLASGAGQGDEYVLVRAKAAPANGESQTSKEAVATAGQQGDYLLTGRFENELKRMIGRQVEVVGVVQPFRANRSAKEDRDRLPRLDMSAWHPAQDFCPAK